MRRSAAFVGAVAALLLAAQCASASVWPQPVAQQPFFPAGFPQPSNPLQVIPPSIPELTANEYRGTYGHTTCHTDELIRPADTAELSAAIKDVVARAAKAGRALKMRATHDDFATMQSFPCSKQPTLPVSVQDAGEAKPPIVAGILLDKLTKLISVDPVTKVMNVQAQMNLKELYAAATAAKLSPPRSSLPWWQGLTLGGIYSTSSHGSGLNTTSMICDWIIDITWVDAKGTVHVSKKGSDEAVALCGGLGLLGAITEMKLQLVDYSYTRLSTWYIKDDDDIAGDILKMLNITPHLVVMWRPDIKKYTGHMQRPAPPGAPVIKDAQSNVIPQFTTLTARLFGPGLRTWQGDPFNKDLTYYFGYDSVSCTAALTSAVGASWATKPLSGPELGLNLPILEGVAPTNQIMSTDCGDRCAWISKGMQATALDVEFAFEKARLGEFVADIKKLIEKDLHGIPGWGHERRCLLPGYYVFRFGKNADNHSLTAMSSHLKEPVYVQQQMLGSENTPGIPTRYEWVQETYEQLMLCKYDGHPHWGKNWDRTFTNPRCPVVPKYGDGFKRMASIQDKYDPTRVFEPQLWTRMAKGQPYLLKPKCVLDHSCYCSADEHCADGFACTPSLAFPEYNSCKPKVMNR